MNKNYLIGAISSNYSVDDIKNWVLSATKLDGVQVVILCYNFNGSESILKFLNDNNVMLLKPGNDYLGRDKDIFESNTGNVNLNNSFELIHNIRFLHMWQFIQNLNDDVLVMVTDVKDIVFNRNPFDETEIKPNTVYYKNEIIKYSDDQWNIDHIMLNCGIMGNDLLDKKVNNVGCWLSDVKTAKYICKMIYLYSVGKPRVADQTAFNFLIYNDNSFDKVDLDSLAIHLHVIINNKTKIKLADINLDEYCVIHQYDRDPKLKSIYDNKY